jgi:hypothetical protein
MPDHPASVSACKYHTIVGQEILPVRQIYLKSDDFFLLFNEHEKNTTIEHAFCHKKKKRSTIDIKRYFNTKTYYDKCLSIMKLSKD